MRCYSSNSRSFSLRKCGAIFVLGLLLGAPIFVQGATTTTPPVGYVRSTLLAESDSFIAISLTRPPVFVGTVESAVGTMITVAGSPNWALGEFTYVAGQQPNTYYARIGAAPEGIENLLEGRAFKVETGGGSSLIVTDELAGTLDALPVGTKIEIIPYWTLNTLFPPEDEGISFIGASAAVIKMEIMMPNYSAKGTDLPFGSRYYFKSGAWRQAGMLNTIDVGDTILEQAEVLKIRNKTENSCYLTTKGAVPCGKISRIMQSWPDSIQDNRLSTGRPVPISLGQLGLSESSAFVKTTSAVVKDNVLVYSNENQGFDKPASARYYYRNNGWRKAGVDIALSFDDVTIDPDVGFIIRKAITPTEANSIWTSSAPY